MAKRWKLIRSMLSAEGYTSVDSAEGVTFQSIDADGLIHWTDADGNAHESYYDGESVATTITISGVPVGMTIEGINATATLVATDDEGTDITSLVSFVSSSANITVSGAALRAETTGLTTTITATMDDLTTISSAIPVYAVPSITNTDPGIVIGQTLTDVSFAATDGSGSNVWTIETNGTLVFVDNLLSGVPDTATTTVVTVTDSLGNTNTLDLDITAS